MTNSPATLQHSGRVEVGHGRETKPIKLYYEMHGTGPEKVLLVMGFSTPCHAWEYQIKFLSQTGRYTCLIFDNRGTGGSDIPVGLYSTSQMARDAFDLLDHFGWSSQVHLVGISMGGMISLEMAYINSLRLKSLTLTSTTAKRNIPTWTVISTVSKLALTFGRGSGQIDTALELVHPLKWLKEVPEELSHHATNRDMVASNFIKNFTYHPRPPIHGNLAQAHACLTHYMSDKRLMRIKKSGIPIMIVTGTIDHLVRPQYSEHLRQFFPEARYEVFKGSGHGIPEERPLRYNQLLDDHFSSCHERARI
ncbi:Alpha/Beta hydrolase protein [Pilobolus umbonatus]|nr:Alpha/Beta hydrolase protein [Pilobolus umbonatus]